MVQSFSSLYVHLVFSTKGRKMILSDDVRDSLHAYMGRVLQNLECTPVLINSVEDHVHLLFSLSRTVGVSKTFRTSKDRHRNGSRLKAPSLRDFPGKLASACFP